MIAPAAHRRTRLLAAVLVGAAALAAAGCGKQENPKPPVDEIGAYAALGDSYTAVAGDGQFTDATCFRSDDDYPALLAKKLGVTDLANASCGGADSENLTKTQYLDGGSNPPQLDAVTAKTKLVTLGMGLNNNNLGPITTLVCLQIGGKVSDACTAYLKQPDSEVDALVAKMGAAVARNLKDIRAKAPDARIVLVGYPRVLAEDANCDSQLPLPGKAADRARATALDVNDELKKVADKAGVDFVDMYAASEGHDICSKEPWVNGQRALTGEALQFHPFEAYHVAVADKLFALLDQG